MPKSHPPKHRIKKPSERLDSKEVDTGLRAIYGDESDVDFTKLDQRPRGLSIILGRLAIALGAVCVLVWSGYFAYLKLGAQNNTDDLIMRLQAIEEIRSGQSDTITFTYQNPKKTPLANLSVRAQLPEGFVINDISPSTSNAESLEWNLGSLDGHEEGAIQVHGVWIVNTPSKQPVQFITTYRPSNFNAEFTKVTSTQITLEKSILDFNITGPESLSAGEIGNFTITTRNTGTDTLPATELELLLPQGFFLEDSSPTLTSGEAPIWKLANLPANGESVFEFSGSFASGQGGFTPFTTTAYFTHQESRLLQTTQTHTVDVAAGDITFDLSLNGKPSNTSALPGENISTTILIENTTNSRITGASVLMDFRAEGRMPIRWGSFNYDGGRLTADGVLWDSSAIGDLDPGEKVILSPSFPLTSNLTPNDARRLDIILHLTRGSGDLKSDIYSIYIGNEASISAALTPQENNNARLKIIFSPPPEPLEDVLISVPFASNMSIVSNDPIPVGTGAFVTSTKEWKWRIPTLPANSATLTTELLIQNIPQEWKEYIELRAINPDTLEELRTNTLIEIESE